MATAHKSAISVGMIFVISKVIRNNGVELFNATKEQGLEGVVSKKLGSHYIYDKRSKLWIKFKFLIDDDFVICGYISKKSFKQPYIRPI